MATVQDVYDRLGEFLERMSEEINVHPDTLVPGIQCNVPLSVMNNQALRPLAIFTVLDRPDGRYLRMVLKGPFHDTLYVKEWKAVYRDVQSGTIIDRPGTS